MAKRHSDISPVFFMPLFMSIFVPLFELGVGYGDGVLQLDEREVVNALLVLLLYPRFCFFLTKAEAEISQSIGEYASEVFDGFGLFRSGRGCCWCLGHSLGLMRGLNSEASRGELVFKGIEVRFCAL